jgi:ABC-type glycerol-3-phosphate transport system substrate-binding protein
LPKRPEDLDAEFHVIAACYDRQALSQSEVGNVARDDAFADRLFSYHYRLKDDQPRINKRAFVHALELLRAMKPFREPGDIDDPAEAFASGRVSLYIASLEDVARFQKPGSAVRGKFRIVKLPGSRMIFDFDNDATINLPRNTVNRMPYLGSSVWFGVVAKNCTDPKAAFEFLAEFGHPEKMGAEMITAAKWGAGPLRVQHTEERSQGLWLGYDFSREETDELVRALKEQIQPSLVNHRFRLRLPNQKEHLEAFDRNVRKALLARDANPKAVLDEVVEEWNALWTRVPAARKHAWIQMSHGLSGSRLETPKE